MAKCDVDVEVISPRRHIPDQRPLNEKTFTLGWAFNMLFEYVLA
jgi:hypothetical protein